MVNITHVLDTDLFTLLAHGVQPLTGRVESAPEGTLAVSVITIEESLSGWLAALRKSGGDPDATARIYSRMAATAQAFGKVTVITYGVPAMVRFDGLWKLKLNVGRSDLRIAAIALNLSARVATRNLRDFGRVPGPVAEDWAA